MTDLPIIEKAKGHFHGGVHPQEFKSISNQAEISALPSPSNLVIPLQQHIGNASQPIVNVGETVEKGQLIASCTSGLGANIHAPVSGIVKSIGPHHTGHPSGLPTAAIELETNDQQNLNSEYLPRLNHWREETSDNLRNCIKNAGIVGLGGATFPTEAKLKTANIKTLIVNAMECEPYITCDDRLLREHPEQVIEGSQIAAKIVNATEIIFAIEDNKPEAISSLEKAIRLIREAQKSTIDSSGEPKNSSAGTEPSLRIVIAPTKYPSGGEKQTIELVTGKQVPKDQLPASLGLLVQNVATLHSIYNAVVNQKPLTERLVTITGDLVNKPGNYWIPFGTKLTHLIETFEVDRKKISAAILGGPMMGQSISNFDTPVTKSTNCIIFNRTQSNEKSWVIETKPHQACIRCSECQQACPVDLLPQQLYWFSESKQWEPLEKQGLFDCIECGACAYVCPSEIPLVHYYRFGKSEIRKNKANQEKAEKAKQRFEFREMRLARAKEERAMKHKKAAEERKKAANNQQEDPSGKQAAINRALERVKQKKAGLAQSQTTQDSGEANE
ncbi:electron transport complex subunit RsxC [Aliikangiella coralliicola]|uniref:Ion-translocating oxidoreductase complex subunit C n=1 Tax=Aliikangiella coralliicola TaxID=2592383 RepID=A0A545UDE5_9GAMM|nr:electron transport complex subunit RsxC [Aliikangiella coralliicola]TQV87486.1 electron transport complex subunit RsxC [Aliikangiella coralliicola]